MQTPDDPGIEERFQQAMEWVNRADQMVFARRDQAAAAVADLLKRHSTFPEMLAATLELSQGFPVASTAASEEVGHSWELICAEEIRVEENTGRGVQGQGV